MKAEFAKKTEVHAIATWDDEEGRWVVEISSIDHIGNDDGITRVMTGHGIFAASVCDEFVIANSLLHMNGIISEGITDLSREDFKHFKIMD